VTTLAVVHPTNLLGKELRETLEHRAVRWSELRLLSTLEDEIGTLTEVAGAAAVVQRYEPETLEGVGVAFFCGPAEANRPIVEELPPDATGILLSLDATAGDAPPVVAGVNPERAAGARVLLSAHPVAILLAHLLHPLAPFRPESAVATVVEPASVADDPGIQELFEETRQILSMSGKRSHPVFGSQLSFNLIPAAAPAEPVEEQLRAVLADAGGAPPRIALQRLQGGVFHGLSASLHVRFETSPDARAVRRALIAHPFVEPAEKPRALGPIDAAGGAAVLAGAVRRSPDGGFWIWAVMDNLTRGGALNAIELAESAL
jgi:aspartate-semialdehyde dehydrogenase